MPRVRLTDRFISALKPSGPAQIDYFDEATPGLFLRVSATRKSWGLLYDRPVDGKRARTTFSSYPTSSLADARGRAIELRAGLSEGKDAAEHVRQVKTGLGRDDLTVKGLCEAFILDRRQRGRRTVDAMERTVNGDVIPIIGAVVARELKRSDLARVTDRIRGRGSETQANRVASLLKAMTAWAVDKGILDSDPGYRWKPPSEARQPRERVFSAAEVKAFWLGLEQAEMARPTIDALKLCLATGARQGEVCGMSRDEVDMGAQLWRLPASRSKNGRPHVVPLNRPALEILARVLNSHNLPAVFPGPKGTALLNTAVSRSVQRSQKSIGLDKWTPHDLRRTAASFMAELGVAAFDIGLVLNHVSTTKSSVTTSTYIKHDYLPQKRAALDLWGARLIEILASAAEERPNKSRKRYGASKRKAAA